MNGGFGFVSILDGLRLRAAVKWGRMLSMGTVSFDTLKFANRLKAAGVPDKQAEAEAEILGEALEVNLKSLVTEDMLRRELLLLEQRITIKLGGIIAVAVGILIAVMRLPH